MRQEAWKMVFFFVSVVFVSSGCIHAKEKLIINEDGSGVLEAYIKVHSATMQLMDQLLGGMMQAAAGKKNSSAALPLSVAEGMFSKDAIMKKFSKSAGLIQMEAHSLEKKPDGLYVDYRIKVADVLAFVQSKEMNLKARLMKNSQGDWFLRPLVNENQIEKQNLEMQKLQMEEFKKSSEFQSMPADEQKSMIDALLDMQFESSIVFPSDITEASGIFEKVDGQTAVMKFRMDMLESPELWDKFEKSAKEAIVRTGNGPLPDGFLSLDFVEMAKAPKVEYHSDGNGNFSVSSVGAPVEFTTETVQNKKVRVQLKSGRFVEGDLVEKGNDFVKINYQGVVVTYYQDEIESLNNL